MPTSAGYTVDQLLSWSLEDRLIDSYRKEQEAIVIVKGDQRYRLTAAEAEAFLKEIFRHSLCIDTQGQQDDLESGLPAGKSLTRV